MSGWDPDAFLQGELEEIGLDPTEYDMYLDTYDWNPEQLAKSKYATGIDTLKSKFEASAMTLDNQVSGTGFESSYMEEQGERTLYDEYFTSAGQLEDSLASDIFGYRKKFKKSTWDDITWLMEQDPELREDLGWEDDQ